MTSVRYAKDNNHKWFCSIKNCLDTIGIGQTNPLIIHKKAFERMKDIFHQEAFSDINRVDSKLRTYALIKPLTGIEKYILTNANVDERISITKLRLSNHDLMIEKGRHLKIEKTQRFCPFCPNLIETEQHFLLQCKTFDILRAHLTEDIETTLPYYSTLPEDSKFKLLFSEQIITHSGKFIHASLQLRKFLLEKHRTRE